MNSPIAQERRLRERKKTAFPTLSLKNPQVLLILNPIKLPKKGTNP
jgi:hypothetical protein